MCDWQAFLCLNDEQTLVSDGGLGFRFGTGTAEPLTFPKGQLCEGDLDPHQRSFPKGQLLADHEAE